jgi:hypothetical protein
VKPRLPHLLELDHARRALLKGGLAAFLASLPLAPLAVRASAAALRPGAPGFEAIAPGFGDTLHVARGHRAQVLYRWGDECGIAGAPAAPFRPDASNSAAEQTLQAGMHHDGMHYFPIGRRSTHGLLVLNHEYTDDNLLHPDGTRTWSAEKLAKTQAAQGVSVIEVRQEGDAWRVVRPSPYARRITARTPMRIAGPAAGHALMRTAADPDGREVIGTFANCAHGHTPWGTYLTCEENFHGYFVHEGEASAELSRYGVRGRGFGLRWNEFEPRFDAARHPNEPNRFGWVVEIDPFDARSVPVKRTALGRFTHEGATVTRARDGRVAVYMADDQRYEHIYKFVSSGRYDPLARHRNFSLLDSGTLYAAKFEEGGRGRWLALPPGAASRVYTRLMADEAGATQMDRPEWIAVHPMTREVYVSLTNNSRRGTSGNPRPDAANPRAQNLYGHIVRWREADGDAAAESFEWDIFLLGGEEAGFGSPDALWFDAQGLLWILTDGPSELRPEGPYAKLGNNQMLAADVRSGEVRRFLTGPAGCEVTGATGTPDGRTLFVNIQHPGEGGTSDPDHPGRVSRWPDMLPNGRPRSATLAIRREDGGVVGT